MDFGLIFLSSSYPSYSISSRQNLESSSHSSRISKHKKQAILEHLHKFNNLISGIPDFNKINKIRLLRCPPFNDGPSFTDDTVRHSPLLFSLWTRNLITNVGKVEEESHETSFQRFESWIWRYNDFLGLGVWN